MRLSQRGYTPGSMPPGALGQSYENTQHTQNNFAGQHNIDQQYLADEKQTNVYGGGNRGGMNNEFNQFDNELTPSTNNRRMTTNNTTHTSGHNSEHSNMIGGQQNSSYIAQNSYGASGYSGLGGMSTNDDFRNNQYGGNN